MKKMIMALILMAFVSVSLIAAPAIAAEEKKDEKAVTIERISPKEIYEKVQTGEVLLVCAYDSDEKFANVHLKGAISLSEFKSKLKDTGKEKLFVFYCG